MIFIKWWESFWDLKKIFFKKRCLPIQESFFVWFVAHRTNVRSALFGYRPFSLKILKNRLLKRNFKKFRFHTVQRGHLASNRTPLLAKRRWTRANVQRECPERMSRENVQRECPERMLKENVGRESRKEHLSSIRKSFKRKFEIVRMKMQRRWTALWRLFNEDSMESLNEEVCRLLASVGDEESDVLRWLQTLIENFSQLENLNFRIWTSESTILI